ncbi:putative retrotransposon protein [Klebsormidium nitens]|uniref:Putative retrotransposon protein n=1 Tax=Klebsormidium nitens TaxID=105231 RepID=A0A1Y1IR39_KLENI|nr:putative retrotransposon protein [Klebsormidium nitens]|eukprot:GAQ91226.1 putative retrotransposon protein [Klebsormidium nitens]
MVYDENMREWQEPNAGERVRIMGLLRGSTEALGVSETDRSRLIGAAINVRAWGGGEDPRGVRNPERAGGRGARAGIGEFFAPKGSGAEEEAVEIEGLRSLAHGRQEEKGAEQFGKGAEEPFEWGAEQIWPGLTEAQRERVVELLETFREIFGWSIYDLNDTAIEGVEFEVEFTADKPIFAPRQRFSQYEHELLKAYCEEREAAKLITRLKLPPWVKEPTARRR